MACHFVFVYRLFQFSRQISPSGLRVSTKPFICQFENNPYIKETRLLSLEMVEVENSDFFVNEQSHIYTSVMHCKKMHHSVEACNYYRNYRPACIRVAQKVEHYELGGPAIVQVQSSGPLSALCLLRPRYAHACRPVTTSRPTYKINTMKVLDKSPLQNYYIQYHFEGAFYDLICHNPFYYVFF